MSTGMTVPFIDSVAELYCLQNSIVWMPCGPGAVPGARPGVAPPASSWILTTATIFLAMVLSLGDLELRDLGEVELHRGLSSENVHEHLDLQLVLVDLGHVARERGEGTGLDLHGVVHFELVGWHATLGRRDLDTLDEWTDDVVDLAARECRRSGLFGAHETGDARRRADDVEDLGVRLAADQEVTREHALGDGDLFAGLELGDVLFGQVDLVDLVLELAALDDVAQRADHLLLVTGEGVHDVPTTGSVEGALGDGLFEVLFEDGDLDDLVGDDVLGVHWGFDIAHDCLTSGRGT